LIFDKRGYAVNDQLTRELKNNSYSDIELFLEHRSPGVFIACIKSRGQWLWGYSRKLIWAITNMLKTIETRVVPNAGPIPFQAIKNSAYFIEQKTGKKILDPLYDEMISRHRQTIKIILNSNKDGKIIAKITSNRGKKYNAIGDNVTDACNNLFVTVNLLDVNLKKHLPRM